MAKSRGVLSSLSLFFGALLLISGLIFTLQGLGIVGPSSSFMYNSSAWIMYGLLILVVGAIVAIAGLKLRPHPVPIAKQNT